MNCPRNKNICEGCLVYKASGVGFICSGIIKNPSVYKKDKVMLCIKGELTDKMTEMTIEEAGFIISVLASTIATLSPAIKNKPKLK
jgi:hypothetical protein